MAQTYYYTKDPTRLTRFLIMMLKLFLVTAILFVIANISNLSLIQSIELGPFDPTPYVLIVLAFYITLVITWIAFIKWKERANLNCHGFGAQGMRFKPESVTVYYAIPFLNLVKPYQAMTEIWKVSKNPSRWQNEKGSPLIIWWWILWLGFWALFSLKHFINPFDDAIAEILHLSSNMDVLFIIVILAGIICVCSCIVTIRLVSAIYAMQEGLVRGQTYEREKFYKG
jgi:hypothetical protein